MGVDLRILPVLSPKSWVAHTMIDLERRSALWEKIGRLESVDIPEPIWCFLGRDEDDEESDYQYGQCLEDPYGVRLKWVTAGDLLTLQYEPEVLDNHKNQAAWAYLMALPKDWPIILYWH